jgi:hypothetical protein
MTATRSTTTATGNGQHDDGRLDDIKGQHNDGQHNNDNGRRRAA